MTGLFKNFFFTRYPALVLSNILVAALILGGCSAYSNLKKSSDKLVRDFRAPDHDLKKRVGMIPLNNQVRSANQDIAETIDQRYLEIMLPSCPELQVHQQKDLESAEHINLLPKKLSGVTDNLALIQIGKQLGLSAVVSSSFSPISVRLQDRGIFWFRKKIPFVWITVSMEIYDIETGAKFLDQTFSREFKVTSEQADSIREGKVSDVHAIEKAISDIFHEMAGAMCDLLVRQPWKGYVTGISADVISLSAGSESGLQPGRILQVYAPGELIQGSENQSFQLPGKKTGEIKITAVFPDKADAVGIRGDGFQAGDILKTK